jgi:segregation and condensation protein B
MDNTKKTIEAALFISGRWMSVEDLARVVGSGSVGSVKEALRELKSDYDGRSGGVQMANLGDKYRLEIDPAVRDKVYYLAPEPELSPALIKTLALIAYKQPIYQSKVVKVIGNRAYEYIKELRKKEFISVKKKGRTKMLSTTGKFNKYFALDEGAQFKPDLGEGAKILEEAQKRLDDMIEEPEEGEALTEGDKKVILEEKDDIIEDGETEEQGT